jgi:hypothetical protein
MIVLSVGMPRAGSAWHYSIIHDLMVTSGSADTRDIRVKYRLQNVLTEGTCNIGLLSLQRLGKVMIPALMGNTFVIKAHTGPTRTSRLLQRLGLLRITYMYRDPRDALLSALETGREGLQTGRLNAFSHLTDFNKSLDFIMEYVHIWERWTKEKNILLCRYEDLLTKYDLEITRLIGFLPLNGDSPEVQKVTERYRPGAGEKRDELHFHMGKIGRFRESFTAQEQSILKDTLASYLPRMGYDV